ncbi:MAG: ligase-associated DNA damage response endonuclease PdeM [Planctomycetota bacterium]
MGAGSLDIEIRGERLTLMPERAVWWPSRRTVLVADLHWGKAETMRTAGVPVPRGTVHKPLARLSDLARRLDPDRILVLGDLLHAGAGLTDDIVEDVSRWRLDFAPEIQVIPGNHDRALGRVAERWGLTEADRVVIETPFAFTHDPADAPDGEFSWCGHLHPSVRVSGRGDSLKLPCFFVGEDMGVLPAFSTFTGGGGVPRDLAGSIYACAGDGVVAFSGAC